MVSGFTFHRYYMTVFLYQEIYFRSIVRLPIMKNLFSFSRQLLITMVMSSLDKA